MPFDCVCYALLPVGLVTWLDDFRTEIRRGLFALKFRASVVKVATHPSSFVGSGVVGARARAAAADVEARCGQAIGRYARSYQARYKRHARDARRDREAARASGGKGCNARSAGPFSADDTTALVRRARCTCSSGTVALPRSLLRLRNEAPPPPRGRYRAFRGFTGGCGKIESAEMSPLRAAGVFGCAFMGKRACAACA